ncbi:MAG: glycerol kinase, partial [Brevibacterium sp.]|nr:glycerol kinase [Brevibacterium sp.]
YVNKNHIARAALESVAFQSREVLDAMDLDSGVALTELKVDGGMVANETLMQFQADLLGVPVIRPEVVETTALGAAYAAGIAVKFWNGEDDVKANWREGKRWEPSMGEDKVARVYRLWNKAVEKSKKWVDEDVEELQG